MPDPRLTPTDVREMLDDFVFGLLGPAGLHWHNVASLADGVICSDTPEGVVERIFQLFESRPDLPAVLIYSADGINMALALGSKHNRPIGTGYGPRQPGQLTDAMVAMVAMVVGRPERLNWLRYFDTGSASPFVGIALATMASYVNADASVVMPLRRQDQVTLITVSSPTPGKKPDRNPFGVTLMPQTASQQWPVTAPTPAAPQRSPEPTRFIGPEQVAKDKQTLDRFIADGPGVDLSKPD